MTLEELIRGWFIKNEEIAGRMARYAGQPAIFLQSAPADRQTGWDQKSQYPRIVNTVLLRADSERKRQGVLTVDFYCDLSASIPEEIEPLIRTSLKDILMQPDDGPPYCFAWQRTDPFELESRSIDERGDKRIGGYRLQFDVLEFPNQFMTYPDPIESLSIELKEEFPDMFVVGIDKIDKYQVATEDNPVLYCRMESYQTDHVSMGITWINCKIALHIIAPSADARSKWVRVLSNFLMMSGEAVMTDMTPLRYMGVQATQNADYLITGQVMLQGQYTLPRYDQGSGSVVRAVRIKEG